MKKVNLKLLRGSIILGITIIFLIALNSCGGRKYRNINKTGLDMPDWFVSPPQSKEYLYGVGTATSKMIKVALDRAKLEAKKNIAASINSKLEALKKDFIESTGLKEEEEIISQYTSVQKELVSAELSGVTLESKSMIKEGPLYRVYVLMKYPMGEMAQRFLKRLSTNQRLYTEFKASKAYQELKKEIEEYEKKRGY
jgi:hypothetical protein